MPDKDSSKGKQPKKAAKAPARSGARELSEGDLKKVSAGLSARVGARTDTDPCISKL